MSFLDELRRVAEEVKCWPKWMRVEHELMKEAERWFNEKLPPKDTTDAEE